MTIKLLIGDCRDVMKTLDENSIDSIVTDPPYGLKFMGKGWDHGVPDEEFWIEALRVAKPGAHLVAFGGTRTYHRLVCAIEDAGWEIRDSLIWLFGSGFPKSLDVSKAIDKMAGAERKIIGRYQPPNGAEWNLKQAEDSEIEAAAGTFTSSGRRTLDITAAATDDAKQWDGWGTALKPGYEPIVLARKPLIGTVATNVLKHGTGGININECRIEFVSDADKRSAFPGGRTTSTGAGSLAGPADAQSTERSDFATERNQRGRWPANVCFDEEAAKILDQQSGVTLAGTAGKRTGQNKIYGKLNGYENMWGSYGDIGGASRFFYCAKASKSERNMNGAVNTHPTVKPVALMQWLCRLITPPNGTILDPFMGSGTTGIAAKNENMNFIGIDENAEYGTIAETRTGKSKEQTVKKVDEFFNS